MERMGCFEGHTRPLTNRRSGTSGETSIYYSNFHLIFRYPYITPIYYGYIDIMENETETTRLSNGVLSLEASTL